MLTPEIAMVIFAGMTLVIYWTVTAVGAVVAIFKKIDRVQITILADVNKKHEENRVRVDAISALVIRHDTILDPEFDGHFSVRRGKS